MSKFVVSVSWDQVPHLDDKTKAELLASIPPFERDARSQGIPQLGAGRIYPISESDITVSPFKLPRSWPRVYGMDVGWERTCAIWAAIDADNDCVYLYQEYYRSQAEPAVHAQAIKAPGMWIPGVIDPAARGRGQVDGRRMLEMYGHEYGLSLEMADNSVDTGLQSVWSRLSSGRLKIFANCEHWFREFRFYRRDTAGKIVKKEDHLMDATRYLIMTGLNLAMVEPRAQDDSYSLFDSTRSATTGY